MKKLIFLALLGLATPAFADDTLFADMGGQPVIDRLADASMEAYLADPRIAPIFSESNTDRIRAEFRVQFCQVAGGPCQYTGHDMVAAHKGLRLTNAAFNALVEDLQGAMTKVGIGFATQNRFLARLAPMQRDVVTK